MPGLTYTLKADGTKLDKGLNSARNSVDKFRKDLDKKFQVGGKQGGIFGAVLGGNLAAKGVEKLGNAIVGAATAAGDLVDISDQLGISVEKLSKLERVFEGSGVGADDLRKAFLKLIAAQQAVRDGSDEAKAKFAAFGISVQDVINANPLDLFLRMADGMKGLGDESRQAAATMDILGSKNAKLLGGMKQGGKEIRKAMEEVGGVTDKNAKAVDSLTDGIQAGFSKAKDSIVDGLGGGINFVSDKWTAFKDSFKNDAEEIGDTLTYNLGDLSGPIVDAQEEAAAAAKKATEDAEKQRRIAEQALADEKEAAAQQERKEKAADRESKALEKQNELREDSMTLEQRLADAKAKVTEAQRRFELAKRISGPQSAAAHEASADLAEAQTGLQSAREQKIQRIMGGSTSQYAAERADRRMAKARARAERIETARQKIRDADRTQRPKTAIEKRMDRFMQIGLPENDPNNNAKQIDVLEKIDKGIDKLNQKLHVA
jgi:hypothetical protein